ncbi:MAG: methylenetetrahydrofolate--tRNA-(uracil(54)-C(5))-methyltransferase (FADH(2)-oxidizing) TrmFO [Clostridia bacterium]|nr:methylenetetrahydrofolate--tRNA-(uracil(54)-C(5))-methyltransferase (FADH(2)-oxidizing) TrmFO [Clostridia bacterium]
MSGSVTVVGAGLAGCEAAWKCAENGVRVRLYEMKPKKFTPAHRNPDFAELVCSNSLKAARLDSAAGLMKEEMRRLGSLLLQVADQCGVPAGGALAVDRNIFAAKVTEAIRSHPNIEVTERELTEIPSDDVVIIATGPLTSEPFSRAIGGLCGNEFLNFHDAAAPIVTAGSLDMTRAFAASRYDRGDDDYINCPMNKEEYEAFQSELVNAERAPLHEFESQGVKVYEGCMPIEILASRGKDAIRYGPMKPVGLTDPNTGHRPWANLQLRRENREGTLYNLVGFQTNLKFGEQKRVFGMIPALKNAEFVRYGVMHRNTFLNSPKILNGDYSMINYPNIFFAGQITGVEGYMESAGSGIICGINAVRTLCGQERLILPEYTMLGALQRHICNRDTKDFQPMGAIFRLQKNL